MYIILGQNAPQPFVVDLRLLGLTEQNQLIGKASDVSRSLRSASLAGMAAAYKKSSTPKQIVDLVPVYSSAVHMMTIDNTRQAVGIK